MSQPVNFHTRITCCVLYRLKFRACYQNLSCYHVLFEKRQKRLTYPRARREDVTENYHGVAVVDPYRWLEDPEAKEVKKFVKAQNKLTTKFLSHCIEREYMEKRLSDLFDYPKYSCPFKRGKHYFFFKTKSLEAETVLYKQEVLDGSSTVFLDLNIQSENGTLSISNFSFSENGAILAYALSYCGSDWVKIQFKDGDTGKSYDEVLERAKFTNLAWTHDNRGIFYSCHSDTKDGTETTHSLNQRVYYHILGTKQSADILAVSFPDHPKWNVRSLVSHCGNYHLLFPWQTTGSNCLYYSSIERYCKNGISSDSTFENLPVIPDLGTDSYEYVTNEGKLLFIKTSRNAPNYRVVGIDLDSPSESNWKVIIEEREPMDWIMRVAHNKLIACYIHNIRHMLSLYDMTGTLLGNFELEIGTITCRSGRRDDNVFFFRLETPFVPLKISYIDFSKEPYKINPFRLITLPCFDPEDYMVKQVTYNGKDGTEIPMYVLHKKLFRYSGESFCRIYGYGGFGTSVLLNFSPSRLFIISDFDGVDAIANIRGGGEFGESWHKAGSKENKQNCFDDFISAAEFLIAKKYTNSSKLAIQGGSNGGLLIGACVNQRPDLFAAAIPCVGLMDLLRFHKFTVGYFWANEYGTSERREQFEYLYKISPLHNIRVPSDPNVQYPAMLVMTADHDNRVVPLHSLKYIAELQHTLGQAPQQSNPLLLRISSKSGHGAGKTYDTIAKEYTEIFAFLKLTLGLRLHMWKS